MKLANFLRRFQQTLWLQARRRLRKSRWVAPGSITVSLSNGVLTYTPVDLTDAWFVLMRSPDGVMPYEYVAELELAASVNITLGVLAKNYGGGGYYKVSQTNGNLVSVGVASYPVVHPLVAYWRLDEVSGVRVNANGNPHYDLADVGSNVGEAFSPLSSGCATMSSPCSYGLESSQGISGGDMSVSIWFYSFEQTSDAVLFQSFDLAITFAPDDAVKVSVYTDHNGQTGYFFDAACSRDEGWHHLVVTRNAATKMVKVYLDGVLGTGSTYSSSGTYVGNLTSPGWHNGFEVGNGNGSHLYNSFLDEIAVWQSVLSATDVTTLRNNGTGYFF